MERKERLSELRNDIYNAEEVQSLKLTMSDDGAVARYIIQKSSDIQGVASYTSSGEKEKQQNVFDAVSTQAEDVCNADPECSWSSMVGARDADGTLTASIKDGPIVTITADVPELDALKAEILQEN